MKRLILSLALLVGPLSLAQPQPRDVLGWGKTRWGMTAESMRRLLPNAKKDRTTEGRTFLTVSEFLVAEIPCAVSMELKGGKLSSVTILPKEGTTKNALDLNEALHKKYGKPTHVSEDAPAFESVWRFEHTKITFHMVSIGGKALAYIIYEPTEVDDAGL
jgi:hypothetical protein